MREGGGIPVDCAQSNFSSFSLRNAWIDIYFDWLNEDRAGSTDKHTIWNWELTLIRVHLPVKPTLFANSVWEKDLEISNKLLVSVSQTQKSGMLDFNIKVANR